MIGKYCMSCGKPNDFSAVKCAKCNASFAAFIKPVPEDKAPKSAVVSPKSEVILKMNKPQWPDATPTQIVKKKTRNHNKSGVLPIGDSVKDQGEVEASDEDGDINDNIENDIDEVPDVSGLDYDIGDIGQLNAAVGAGGYLTISQSDLQNFAASKNNKRNKKK